MLLTLILTTYSIVPSVFEPSMDLSTVIHTGVVSIALPNSEEKSLKKAEVGKVCREKL
jgi:hypothetical protein